MKNRARWLKRHGFTNGSWRLEDEERARKARLERRNKQIAEPMRTIVNQISECPPWPLWQYPDLDQ